MGIANFYQFKNDLAWKYFTTSLEVNQSNSFIKSKSLYYMVFLTVQKMISLSL
jgi:hypothetical protein